MKVTFYIDEDNCLRCVIERGANAYVASDTEAERAAALLHWEDFDLLRRVVDGEIFSIYDAYDQSVR